MNSASTDDHAFTTTDGEGDSLPIKARDVIGNSKRHRAIQEDVYYGNLEFNHNISAHYHNLCSEAYRNRLNMEHGIADLVILQEVLKLVDDRINAIQSAAPVPKISLTSRKNPKQSPREEVPHDHNKADTFNPSSPNNANIRKDEEMKRKSGVSTPQRKLSYYRINTSPRSTFATPFDQLPDHKDMAVPDSSPETPTKKPGLRKTRSKGTSELLASTSNVLKSREITCTTVTIISDDDDEDEDDIPSLPIPTRGKPSLLNELNGYRRKLSTSLGRLPEEILPLRTLKQLSVQLPSDYKLYQKILADTSGIPDNYIEEREAYVTEKWKETGSKFLTVCREFRRREEQVSIITESSTTSGTAVNFRKVIATHGHTADKPIDLSEYSFSS